MQPDEAPPCGVSSYMCWSLMEVSQLWPGFLIILIKYWCIDSWVLFKSVDTTISHCVYHHIKLYKVLYVLWFNLCSNTSIHAIFVREKMYVNLTYLFFDIFYSKWGNLAYLNNLLMARWFNPLTKICPLTIIVSLDHKWSARINVSSCINYRLHFIIEIKLIHKKM